MGQTGSSLSLGWTRSPDPRVVSYDLYYGVTSLTYTNVSSVGNVTNTTVTGLVPGTTYFFCVTAVDSLGAQSPFCNQVSYTVPTNGPASNTPPTISSVANQAPPTSSGITVALAPTIPPPWQKLDIGVISVPGIVVVSNGRYSIQGAGNIGGSSDSFCFLYQSLSGDGEITSQIPSLQNTGTGALSAVMIRETLTSGSKYVLMGVLSSGGMSFQRRVNTSDYTDSDTSSANTFPKVWVRVVRTGNTFYGYKSSDGNGWTQMDCVTIAMASNIYIGLAVASGSTTALTTSVATNVTVVP